MKRIIFLALLIITSTAVMSQGIRKLDGIQRAVLPAYDIASGSTEWIIGLEYGDDCLHTWDMEFVFSGLTGTLNGALKMYKSSNGGVTWIPYPNMDTIAVSGSVGYGFDDPAGVAYDQIKATLTVYGLTGGSVSVNERIATIPNK